MFLDFLKLILKGFFFELNPYKFLKFPDLNSFVKPTCKKFAKKTGKEEICKVKA
jgi:hypothetical protein